MNIDQYNAEGYLIHRGLFCRGEVEQVKEEALQVFRLQIERKGVSVKGSDFDSSLYRLFREEPATFINCGKQCQHLVSLHRLSLDERIMVGLRQMGVRHPNICTRPVMFFNSPFLAKKDVYWRVFAHQDWASMQGSLNSVVVWMPLVDVNVELGALEVVPKSHLRGLMSESKEDSFGKVEGYQDDEFVSVELNAGDALFFSSFLVHRSGINSSALVRWSCHFRYNDLREDSFVDRGYPHPYIYKPQDEYITPGFPSEDQVKNVFL